MRSRNKRNRPRKTVDDDAQESLKWLLGYCGSPPLQRPNPFPLWNDPEFYSVSKADPRAFSTGDLDLAVFEHIPSVRLVFDHFVRFDNLNPPSAH
jgi:hypothetical protein